MYRIFEWLFYMLVAWNIINAIIEACEDTKSKRTNKRGNP